MKSKKKVWKILVGLLVFIVIAVVVVLIYLGTIIAEATRTLGTQATGTKVAVESVNVSLLGGDVQINKLAIDNPPGYKLKQAFSFDLVRVDVDINTIFSDTIIINEIEIANIKVNFEPTLKGGSNLTDIKNNIMKFAQSEEDDAKKEAEPEVDGENDPPKKAKKVIIKSFVINEGEIKVSSSILPTSVTLALGRMELNDIGKESNMGKAFSEILTKIIAQVIETVGDAKIESLDIDKLKSTLLKDLPDTAENIGKDISKTIKDLF